MNRKSDEQSTDESAWEDGDPSANLPDEGSSFAHEGLISSIEL